MKQLRVLTGVHAGAQLRLTRQSHIVGAGEEADVEISDWSLPPIRLMLSPDGPVLVQQLDAKGLDEGQPLDDLAPRRFGDVVLCVGPADEAWPSDIHLLEKMVKAPPPPGPAPAVAPADAEAADKSADKRRRWWSVPKSLSRSTPMMVGAGLASVALLSVFVSVVSNLGPANAKVPDRPLSERVARAIDATGVAGVTALATANGVEVEGMVIDGNSAAKLRAALLPFSKEHVAHHYNTATDISQSIADALSNPGLQVSYDGAGVFRVTGASIDMEGVREKLRRIATDLGPAVKRIDIAAADLPPPSTLPAGAVLSTGTLEYVQTRDGTKHMVLLVPPEEAASSAAAVPGPAPVLRHTPKRFASQPRVHKRPT